MDETGIYNTEQRQTVEVCTNTSQHGSGQYEF